MNLRRAELGRRVDKIDLAALEKEFVGRGQDYSERKGITYAAWRELGVDRRRAEAGIRRGS